MEYLANLNRESYAVRCNSKGLYGAVDLNLKPSDQRSRKSIDAFLRVLDDHETLDCIANDVPRTNGHLALVQHIETGKNVLLVLTYRGRHYEAKVTMGNKQLSVKKGVEAASEVIKDYLLANFSKPEKGLPPLINVDLSPDEYSRITEDFI